MKMLVHLAILNSPRSALTEVEERFLPRVEKKKVSTLDGEGMRTGGSVARVKNFGLGADRSDILIER